MLQNFSELYPGYKLIYLANSGSVLHGTNSETSDQDLKGLFVPCIKDLILESPHKVINIKTNKTGLKNSSEDTDIELFSVNEFLRLLKAGNNTAVELLFSMFSTENVFIETEQSFIFKNFVKQLICNKTDSFVGFAMQQAAKYSVKGTRLRELEESINFFKQYRPETKLKDLYDVIKYFMRTKEFVEFTVLEEIEYVTILNRHYILTSDVAFILKSLNVILRSYGARAEKAKNCEGIDFKAFGHAYRAVLEAIELQETHFLKLPLKDASFLKDIKYGVFSTDIEKLSNDLEELYVKLRNIESESTLPENVNEEVVRKIKLEMYKDIL